LTSRSDLDKPAALIAAIIGVVIILVALPFTIAAFPQTPKAYDATWGERAVDATTLTVPSETGSYRATVSARDFQPASVKVEIPTCSDAFSAQFQQNAATMRVKLTETRGSASRVLKETPPMQCPGEGFTIKLGDHADVATAQATDAATAKKIVWLDAMAQNATGVSTYTLEVTPSRPASQVPTLPVTPPTSLGATVRLTLYGWDVAMNEHQKEVGK
jgi:hypothetical protein